MSKSTTILLAVLAILAAGAFFFLNKGDKSKGKGWELALENTAQIHQLTLDPPGAKRITLTRDGDAWLIGNKPARPRAVKLLLETLEKLHIRARVPKAAEENVRRQLKEIGITVTAKNKSGKEIKTWIVGNESHGSFGTYMMLKGGDHPFDVDIMGWEGTLRPRFIIDEGEWRDRRVLIYDPKKIDAVEVRYFNAENKNLSFKLEKKSEKNFTVSRVEGSEKMLKTPILPKILFYLKGYENVAAENFVNTLSKRDSILQTTPFAQITITAKNKEPREVKLFPIPKKEEIERYYVELDGEFLLVQQRNFGKLLTSYDYFFEEEEK